MKSCCNQREITIKIDENVWKNFQSHLGCSNEEMEIFKKDNRWSRILEKSDDLLKKTIVFEVYESQGCNVEHKVGDRFFFSPEGYMFAHKGPKKVSQLYRHKANI